MFSCFGCFFLFSVVLVRRFSCFDCFHIVHFCHVLIFLILVILCELVTIHRKNDVSPKWVVFLWQNTFRKQIIEIVQDFLQKKVTTTTANPWKSLRILRGNLPIFRMFSFSFFSFSCTFFFFYVFHLLFFCF